MQGEHQQTGTERHNTNSTPSPAILQDDQQDADVRRQHAREEDLTVMEHIHRVPPLEQDERKERVGVARTPPQTRGHDLHGQRRAAQQHNRQHHAGAKVAVRREAERVQDGLRHRHAVSGPGPDTRANSPSVARSRSGRGRRSASRPPTARWGRRSERMRAARSREPPTRRERRAAERGLARDEYAPLWPDVTASLGPVGFGREAHGSSSPLPPPSE